MSMKETTTFKHYIYTQEYKYAIVTIALKCAFTSHSPQLRN